LKLTCGLGKIKKTIVEILKYSDWGCWIHFSWKFNYFVKISRIQVVVVTVSSSWDWDLQYETKFREQFAMELLWSCIMYHVSCFWFVSGWWFARLALYEKQKNKTLMILTLSEIKIFGEYLAAITWMSMCYKHKSNEDDFPAKGVGKMMLIFKRVYWRWSGYLLKHFGTFVVCSITYCLKLFVNSIGCPKLLHCVSFEYNHVIVKK
jgi:hypothetical protein